MYLRYQFPFVLHRHLYRYEAVLMRQRFEENKDERDMIIAKQLLMEGEAELARLRHPQPMKCKSSGQFRVMDK